jgi:hypothetical protein
MSSSAYCIVIVILLCLLNAYVVFARFLILRTENVSHIRLRSEAD